ncbi:MAG: zf-HC2 domain-containing protein [Pyrinomonadaceae bacterium]|nr:zf-HC2 domain-containing protein [Pyrinomonadaceae bacterium]
MKHLDEAALQTYVDGELSPANLKEAKGHLAVCADCAALLEETKAEALQVCALFNHENHLPVPSMRLKQRLDAAIAQTDAHSPRYAESVNAYPHSLLDRLSALFSAGFFAPSRVALAGCTVVAVICVGLFVALQRSQNDEQMASVKPPALNGTNTDAFPPWVYGLPQREETSAIVPIEPEPKPTPRVSENSVRASRSTVPQSQSFARPRVREERNAEAGGVLFPGEKSYLNAIASLTDVVESNSKGTLSPSLRAEYERNLAVVDQAITTTRTTAKRNPNDPDAAQFLFSAYQSKIELLNAVADQREIAQR